MGTNIEIQKVILSLILLATLLLLRFLALRWLNRFTFAATEDKRRWIVSLRNAFFAVFILGLIIIWAMELQSIALSLAAVAVALVLALKEIFLCISGGFMRTSSRAFGIGDRIEVAGLRGDVIDENLLVTTLLEIGPGELSHQYTGRSVTFPNALLFSHAVTNETYTDDYVLHPFIVPMKLSEPWQRAERILLEVAREECAPFFKEAQKHMDEIGRRRSLETPDVHPRVTLHLPEPGRVDLLVRIPAPARKKGRIEQLILRRLLQEMAREDLL